MKREETAACLAVLAAAFPYVPVTKETASVYHDALQDIDPLRAMEAVKEIVQTSERFPAPATIRRKVAEQAGVLAPSSTAAFSEVMEKARTIGRREYPGWSHPAITAVVKAIGWSEICLSDNPDSLRAHFFRLYEDQRKQFDLTSCGEGISSLPVASNVTVRVLGA